MLPKVLASAVIRSNVRKRYDGGLFLVDLNNNTFEQKLDWNIDKVDWRESLGDVGLRGLAYWKDNLYCCSSEEILVFNKKFELINRYTSPIVRGTHECCVYDNKLYIIANQFDTLLEFDIVKEIFTKGIQLYYDQINTSVCIFNPQEYTPNRSDTVHLDMIFIQDDWLCWGGSQYPYLGKVNLKTKDLIFEPVLHPSKWGGTHNLSYWKQGLFYCLSDENKICYQKDGEVIIWTPPITENILWSISSDYAKAGYVRGCVLTENEIIVGSSPAKVMVFNLEHKDPIALTEISKNICVSICGLCKYEWTN